VPICADPLQKSILSNPAFNVLKSLESATNQQLTETGRAYATPFLCCRDTAAGRSLRPKYKINLTAISISRINILCEIPNSFIYFCPGLRSQEQIQYYVFMTIVCPKNFVCGMFVKHTKNSSPSLEPNDCNHGRTILFGPQFTSETAVILPSGDRRHCTRENFQTRSTEDSERDERSCWWL